MLCTEKVARQRAIDRDTVVTESVLSHGLHMPTTLYLFGESVPITPMPRLVALHNGTRNWRTKCSRPSASDSQHAHPVERYWRASGARAGVATPGTRQRQAASTPAPRRSLQGRLGGELEHHHGRARGAREAPHADRLGHDVCNAGVASRRMAWRRTPCRTRPLLAPDATAEQVRLEEPEGRGRAPRRHRGDGRQRAPL